VTNILIFIHVLVYLEEGDGKDSNVSFGEGKI